MPRIHWTLKRALAAAALLLGLFAIPGNPYRGSTVRIDTQELATIVSTEVDHVTPQELADWIIQGRTDYRLANTPVLVLNTGIVKETQGGNSTLAPTADPVSAQRLEVSQYPRGAMVFAVKGRAAARPTGPRPITRTRRPLKPPAAASRAAT